MLRRLRVLVKPQLFVRSDFMLAIRSLMQRDRSKFTSFRLQKIKSISTEGWDEFTNKLIKILNNVHPRFYAASSTARKAFSPIGHAILPYRRSLNSEDISQCCSFAYILSNNFSHLDYNTALAWTSAWMAIREDNFKKSNSSDSEPDLIIEFGGGLGIFPLMMSGKFPNASIAMYDLPEMSILQQNTHKYLSMQGAPIDLSKISYITDREKLLQTIQGLALKANIHFYAFWSFSESPLSLREDFLTVLKMCKHILIVSNKSIFGIDNEEYFRHLANCLADTHHYLKRPLPLTEECYLSNHASHYFVMKDQASAL